MHAPESVWVQPQALRSAARDRPAASASATHKITPTKFLETVIWILPRLPSAGDLAKSVIHSNLDEILISTGAKARSVAAVTKRNASDRHSEKSFHCPFSFCSFHSARKLPVSRRSESAG